MTRTLSRSVWRLDSEPSNRKLVAQVSGTDLRDTKPTNKQHQQDNTMNFRNSQIAGWTNVAGSGCGLYGVAPTNNGSGGYIAGPTNENWLFREPGSFNRARIFATYEEAVEHCRARRDC